MASIQERKAKIKSLWSDAPWDEVAAFIGPNAEKFRPMWEKQRTLVMNKGSGIVWGFSWAVFFFFFVWFFARKQWLVGVILIVVPFALGMILPNMTGALGGVGVALAMMARSLYLQEATGKVAKIREAFPAGAERSQALAAAGGLSWPATVLSGLLYAALVGLALVSVLR